MLGCDRFSIRLHPKGKREGLYKFRSRPRRKSRFWSRAASLLFIFSAITFWSSRNEPQLSARIFTDGVRIQVTRPSPPYAALEDSLSDFSDESSESPFGSVTLLQAEAVDTFAGVAKAILASNAQIAAQRLQEQQTLQRLAQAQARAEALEKASEVQLKLAEAQKTQAQAKTQIAPVSAVVVRTRADVDSPGTLQASASGRPPDVLAADPNAILVTGGKLIPLTAEGVKTAQSELARVSSGDDQLNEAGDRRASDFGMSDQAPRDVSRFEPPIESSLESSRTINLNDLKISRAELVKSLFFPLVAAATQAERQKSNSASSQVASTGTRVGAVGGSRRTRPPPTEPDHGFAPAEAAGIDHHLRDAMSAALASRLSKRGEDKPAQKSGKDELSERGQTDDVAEALAPSSSPERQLVISGPIELSGGLAFTSAQDQIRVYRQVDDQKLESGNVRLREGRYEIFVDNTDGILLAELQTSKGLVLGRGVYDLYEMSALEHNQTRSPAIALKLQPVHDGFRGLVQSADSNKGKSPLVVGASLRIDEIDADLKTGNDGRFVDRQIAAGSTVILEAHKDGYWRSLGYATAGYDNAMTLYPDKMMKAFVELVVGQSPQQDPKQQAIVWGKVMKDGQPVAGAKVEMLTGTNEIKPIYFNSLLIPDPTLSATTVNGLYAFFPVEAGVHALEANLNGATTDPILFPAEPGYIATMDLETSRLRRADLKVFDAFNPQMPLSAEIAAVGADRGFAIDGAGHLLYRYAPGSSLIFLEADAGREYTVTRYAFPRDRRFLYMPMIQQSWLDQIGGRKRVSREPGAGVIIGFVQTGDNYQVYPQGNALSSATRVVYFDSRGKALATDYGVPGGGYLIFNVGEGFHTVSVVSSKGGPAQSLTTLVDKGVLNVMNHVLVSH